MPLQLHRHNSMGQEYIIRDLFSDGPLKTIISTGNKSITVDHSIDKINQGWYDWMMGGRFIQDAFPFLTPDEREFLLTGTTLEEWNAMFPKEEE